MSEPRKSLDETDDAEESSDDDERSYETPEERRKQKFILTNLFEDRWEIFG